MVEIELISIGVLGLALFVALWLLATRKSEVNSDDVRMIAIEIANIERKELRDENEQQLKQMEGRVDKVTEENVEIKTLVGRVTQAQEATATAVLQSTQVSQQVANALGGNDPHVKKEYGEGRAEHILTSAGLLEGEHFLKQPALAPYEGNSAGKSPDYVLRLSGGGATALDCKAIVKSAFNAFYELDVEEDAAKKKALLGEHAGAVWETVYQLAERNYPLGLEQQYGKGPDYTLMFIPSDEFLYRAEIGVSDNLRKNMGYNTLREAAIRRRVFLCSPDSLAMKAIDLMDHWKSSSALDDVNDVLTLVQDVAEAIVETEEKKSAHHKALEKSVSTWNAYVKETESSHGGRKKPSLRVAISNLFEKVRSKRVFSSVRGQKGVRKEPIPLDEVSDSALAPTKSGVTDIHLTSRLTADAVTEEE